MAIFKCKMCGGAPEISENQSVAVGDNINDTHMISEFHSYAMENAVESIKALADDIVCDVTEIIAKEI